MKTRTCVLCDSYFAGAGHNAQPLNVGMCCSVCMDKKVIPARMNYLAITGEYPSAAYEQTRDSEETPEADSDTENDT